jgi:hypothetical protein
MNGEQWSVGMRGGVAKLYLPWVGEGGGELK